MTVLKGQRRDSTPTQAQPEVFQSIIQITASERQIHGTLFGYFGDLKQKWSFHPMDKWPFSVSETIFQNLTI